MEHIAIDLGGRESQVCVRGATGEILEERRVPTSGLGRYLRQRPMSRVVVETCAEAFSVADQALALGHEIRVIPATLVRGLGVGSRRLKTDRRDAQILSEVSTRIDLPSVHIPTTESRRRKSLCGMREGLVRSRTMLVNTVSGWLRTQGIRVRRGVPETLGQRVVDACGEVPPHVARNLNAVRQLSELIAEADKELAQLAKEDIRCRRLMTVPGVGPVTSVRFVAALDDVTRFAGAHEAGSYLGLTPGESSSSDRVRRIGITKAGAPSLRFTLVQAAWSAWRTRPHDPMVQWAYEVAKRRGRRVAIIALARKISGILYALWRDASVYDPRRGARVMTLAERTAM